MPPALTAQWCQVGDGAYVAAKRFCAKERDPMYLCVPQEVTATGSAWRVAADCGPNDNSGPVRRLSFTFKPDDGRMSITFGDPR